MEPKLTTIEILALARKHATSGGMQSSAQQCLADAARLAAGGDYANARRRACKSLAYSVGVFHADYTAASGGKHWARI